MRNAKDGRDELDDLIRSALERRGRQPEGLPAPGRGEPDDEVLLRVLDGTASSDEVAAVEAAGPWTQDRLALLRDAVAETGHAVPAATQVARYVFRVAKDALDFLRGPTQPVLSPALAVRGEPQATLEPVVELVPPFAKLDARVKVEYVERNGAPTIDLRVATRATPPQGARAVLLRGARTVDNVPLEADGSATITGLEPARYTLQLRWSGQVMGTVVLDFLE